MSKENYINYFNGGCSTCMFAERDERGRYIGSCSGFSNCSYGEYKGETDITEEEKDEKISDLEAKLAECEKKHLLDEKEWQDYCAYKYIEPQIKGCLDREWQYEKKIDQLKQQLSEKDKELLEIKQRIAEKASKEFQEMIDKRENHNQDKISF